MPRRQPVRIPIVGRESDDQRERRLTGRAKAMLEMGGATLGIGCERTPEAVERDGADATISREAHQDLMDATGQWILSRIIRRHEQTGKMAQKVEIEVKVRLDDEPIEGEVIARFTALDGTVRLDASEGTG